MFFSTDKPGCREMLTYDALATSFCHFVFGCVLSAGEHFPSGDDGKPNVLIRVPEVRSNTVIVFCYLLMTVHALALALLCCVYAPKSGCWEFVLLVWV